jgi:SOS response regulatory protein OraA/RecX
MDRKFSSDLQTTLHTIGREGKFSAPKSQDTMDAALHEYFVSDTASSIFTKRRTAAKDYILEHGNQDAVNSVISGAVQQNSMQSVTLAATEHYTAVFKAAKPIERLDKVKLRTELIKLGVDQVTIEKAFDASTVMNEPAKTLTVTTTHAR